MVPFEGFVFKSHQCKAGKHNQSNDFLYYLKLHQRERATIAFKSNSVGRNLKKIFEECNSPANEDYGHKWQGLEPFHFLEFQMPVPSHRHKNVGQNQQANGVKSLHVNLFLKPLQM